MYLPDDIEFHSVLLYVKKDSLTFNKYDNQRDIINNNGRPFLSGFLWVVEYREGVKQVYYTGEDEDNEAIFVLRRNKEEFNKNAGEKEILNYVETIPLADIISYEVIIS